MFTSYGNLCSACLVYTAGRYGIDDSGSIRDVVLNIEVATHAPIERIEVRNGVRTLEVVRPYTASELGSRIRVIWSGAEYRGRGRETVCIGRACFNGSTIVGLKRINFWNP